MWPSAWRGIAALEAKQPEREWPTIAKLVSASLNTTVPLPRPAVLKRARDVANQLQRPSPPSTESWNEWEPYLQSQLAAEQQVHLLPPSVRVEAAVVLDQINGLTPDAKRGQNLYAAKCILCHGGQSSLGPSLSGVSKRFSRLDLMRAIVDPSRDISDRYRAVRVLTVDDEILTGMIIYNAADGVTLQAADGSILRINQDAIQEKGYSTESLMPVGLLDDKSPQDIADLLAYIGTL
jgi:putative heme-binding domain-containing protein